MSHARGAFLVLLVTTTVKDKFATIAIPRLTVPATSCVRPKVPPESKKNGNGMTQRRPRTWTTGVNHVRLSAIHGESTRMPRSWNASQPPPRFDAA
ncbi:hypothetical protein DFJ74DRAFT_695553 [Hyaloraphidium curvatum]|nr:hypothetical protein DFJ74DRAFT_695553 [Hyaloraphidium curvatum]